jgi:hypothetical protein
VLAYGTAAGTQGVGLRDRERERGGERCGLAPRPGLCVRGGLGSSTAASSSSELVSLDRRPI